VETELVVLSDANAFYEPDALKHLVKYFQDPAVGCVSGRVTLLNTFNVLSLSERVYQWYEELLRRLEDRVGATVAVDGAMCAIRKELYQKVPSNIILDDFVLAMNIIRQGKRIIFAPEAQGYEYAPITVKEGFKTRVRVTAGAMQTLKHRIGLPPLGQPLLLFEYLFHKFLRWMMPLLLLAIFAVNVSLIDQGAYLALLSAQILFYGLALLGYVTGSSVSILSVPFYFCLQNIAIAAGIWQGLKDRQSVMWDKVERFPVDGGIEKGND
ncbi:MAG: hypothetical protein D6736_19680, partial [Nitrospinota bacterium]